MKFVFTQTGNLDKDTLSKLRAMMSTFEVMVNTTLMKQRVHLEEVE